jgi:hypothetical protein
MSARSGGSRQLGWSLHIAMEMEIRTVIIVSHPEGRFLLISKLAHPV